MVAVTTPTGAIVPVAPFATEAVSRPMQRDVAIASASVSLKFPAALIHTGVPMTAVAPV